MALAWSCTKAEAKRRCTVREFAEWIAYDRIEPIGAVRDDIRMAILATVVARGAGSKTAKPKDFMPDFSGGSVRQSPQDMMAICKRMAAENGK
ncbi:MAG: DUF4035 domain-containing protein [Marivivens sp.]|nr:DUF4035 domain-containing protein [Marivivens sp.]NBT50021.1 DUF4035 domain-containing protein [Marivivens sp.]NCW67031.1 DUF4035 domain-containing protein [Marivivens sp.]NDH01532.1 DUF4035 domain-containing protein [Marivivens sp.]